MNYTVNISAHSATAFIGQAEDESEDDFLERAKAAEGKHFMAIRIVDIRKGAQKQFTMQSLYFVLDDEEELEAVITATFEALGKAVAANEKSKADHPDPEPTGLVLPPGFGRS